MPRSHPTDRPGRTWSRRYLAGGLAACAVAAGGFGVWGPVPLVLVVASAPVTVGVGLWRFHPRRSAAWLLLLLYQVVAALRASWLILTGSHEPPGLTIGEVFALISIGAGLIALVAFTAWSGGSGRRSLWDAAIAAFALAVVLWGGVVDPVLGAESLSGWSLLASVVFPVLALLQLGLTIRLGAVLGLRDPARRLLVAAFGVVVVANVAEGMFFAHGVTDGRRVVPLALWVAASVLFGAAVLDPGLSRRLPHRRTPDRPVSSRRTLIFAGLTALAPTVLIIRWIVQPPVIKPVNEGIPAVSIHLVVPVVLSSALTVLLVLRSGGLARKLYAQSEQLVESLAAQRGLQAQLEHRAQHDPLTGLANRVVLQDSLARATERRPATGAAGALLLLDLDGFKDVNDTFGHPVGDQLLRVVAERLTGAVPPGALVCRLGGDEFAVLLAPGCAAEARRHAGAILGALRAPYLLADHEMAVTASVGVIALQAGMRPTGVLRDADLALYAAKSSGKNQIVVYDDGVRRRGQSRAALTSGLRRAVAESQFTLAYQPIMGLSTGRVHGVEALLRWTTPDGVPVPPAEFIPAAELAGLIVPIGEWALRAACAEARRWYAQDGVSVSVNVSGRQLTADDVADTVVAALDDNDLPGDALIVEITETVLIASTDEAREVIDRLARLRRAGVRIAVDDFGTGYSSLAHLRELPVDVLKVDRRFVQDTGSAPEAARARDFTRAILELGSVLGLQTIAEGIETDDQWRTLLSLGCAYGQGYHLAEPAPAAHIDRMLSAPVRQPPSLTSPAVR